MSKTIRTSNIKEFFNYQTISSGSIKPGMLLSFRYSSPDGVHDRAPLIYVLSKEGDRVWGLNLHYHFTLMAQIYNLKQLEVNASKKNFKQTTQMPNPKANDDVLNKVPKLKNILSKTKTKPSMSKPKKKVPVTTSKNIPVRANLDIFVLKQKPDFILRNYLFSRMKSGYKLIYKVS